MAVIPARGGSKRLPRKNILPLAGKPLIGWTIEAAQQSQYIDEVFVSTDCSDIADAAASFGIRIPKLRAAELSGDTATSASVLVDVLTTYGKHIDIVVLLQPTSPLRRAEHIDEALEMFAEKQASSVISVTPCEHSPLWANTLPEDRSLFNFIRREASVRSQDLPQYYRLNGAIYALDARQLVRSGNIDFNLNAFAYVMETTNSIDIDVQLDLDFAEFCLSKLPIPR